MDNAKKNCAGCKWLDVNQRGKDPARGYCFHVEQSSQRNLVYISEYGENTGPKVRRADMKRCELYEEGLFKDRYKK